MTPAACAEVAPERWDAELRAAGVTDVYYARGFVAASAGLVDAEPVLLRHDGVFFASLLPQFGDSFAALLALGLLFCSLTFAWLTLYAAAVDRLRRVLGGPVRRVLDAVAGAVLLALGVRLAAEEG